MIITSQKIYNIKSGMMSKLKMMRSIPLSKIGGVSLAASHGGKEFTVHVPTEYDYRFSSDSKEEVVKVLQVLYFIRMGENLPIFSIKKVKLDEFTTTEKDRNRGRTRFPSMRYRNYDLDLLQTGEARLPRQLSGYGSDTIEKSGDTETAADSEKSQLQFFAQLD